MNINFSLFKPKVGKTIHFTGGQGKPFTVTKLSRETYHLRCLQETNHSRFGNWPQIREDIQHVMETGNLPYSGQRMF